MYCSNCGKTLEAHLNYCNSCGTRVENKQTIVRTGSPMLGIGAIFVGLIGLMAFYPIMRELLHSDLAPDARVMIIALYLATVFGMFTVLIWQSRKGTSEKTVNGNRPSTGFGGQEAFRGINTAQLPEPTEPTERPASVTEHTTRTLDEVPNRKR